MRNYLVAMLFPTVMWLIVSRQSYARFLVRARENSLSLLSPDRVPMDEVQREADTRKIRSQ